MPTSSLDFQRITRRKLRSRAKLAANQALPRLSVTRSLRHIAVQLIDDQKRVTLTASTDQTLGTASKSDKARQVGQMVAEQAIKLGITEVRFDRGAYKYHGRIAALAEGARQAGLLF